MATGGLAQAPPGCLERGLRAGQRGGTLIEGSVLDLAEHQARLVRPGGYRPAACLRCGGSTLHLHDYRHRALRAEAGAAWLMVARYRCAACKAIWLVLPALLARCLRRSWAVVERCVLPGPWTRPPVPGRTRRRWAARMNAGVGNLGDALGVRMEATTRRALVETRATGAPMTPGVRMASLAAEIHRIAPGLRLL